MFEFNAGLVLYQYSVIISFALNVYILLLIRSIGDLIVIEISAANSSCRRLLTLKKTSGSLSS